MTQVQHFVSRIKKKQVWDVQTMWAYDLDLWPWRSPRLSVIRVFVRVPSADFGDTTTNRFRLMGHFANTAQTDHVILRPWSLTLEVMAPVADASCCPPSVYQLWSLLALPFGRYGARCASALMGLVTLTLNLETGVRVASKVGNVHSKFGQARPFGSRIIRCVRDGRTDRRTDKSNAYCRLPYGRGHNNDDKLETLQNANLLFLEVNA